MGWVQIDTYLERDESLYEQAYGPTDTRTIIPRARECEVCRDPTPFYISGSLCEPCAALERLCLDCGTDISHMNTNTRRCPACRRIWRHSPLRLEMKERKAVNS